jgi:hypothetical protein
VNGRWQTAQSDVPQPTFGHYGKQAVKPLAFLMDFACSGRVVALEMARRR